MRLVLQFPRNCMDKLILNAYKNAYKMDFENTTSCKLLLLFTEMDASLVGAPDFKSVPLSSNISDLTQKSVWISVDISKKCGQNVDK